MSGEVVRTQLEKTIKRKEAQTRKLSREEENYRRLAAEVGRKRSAIEAEVDELRTHLDKIGGPVVKEEK